MKKYKIHKKTGEPISDAELARLKSFGQLKQSYQRATKRPEIPIYKNPWAFIALVLIILLTLIITGEI